MSNILDQFKLPKPPASTETSTETPAAPAKPAGPLAGLMAKFQASSVPMELKLPKPAADTQAQSSLLSATKLVSSQTKLAETVATVQTEVAVPPGLLELNPALYEINGFPAQQMQDLLAKTFTALISDQSDLPNLCRAINNNLRQYEELAYLLKPEQVGLFVRGMMTIRNVKMDLKPKKTTIADSIKSLAKTGDLNFGEVDLSELKL